VLPRRVCVWTRWRQVSYTYHVCCRRARGALVAAVPMPSPPPPAASASAAAIISVGFFSVFFPIVSVSSFRMRAPRHASRRAARCAPLNRAPATSPTVTTGTITIVDSRVRPATRVVHTPSLVSGLDSRPSPSFQGGTLERVCHSRRRMEQLKSERFHSTVWHGVERLEGVYARNTGVGV
jgi:hypothetical protein